MKQSKIVKQSFKKGKYTINIIGKEVKDHYLSKKSLEHPHSFLENEVFNNLISLHYKRLALFSNKEQIFDKDAAREISPLLTRAFKNAEKNDIIEFNVQSPRGLIAGNIFIFNNKLNWRFNIINGASFERRNSRDYIDSWKLVIQKGQKYHGKKELFGVRIAKNWIVYPVNRYNDSIDESRLETFELLTDKPLIKEPSPTQDDVEVQFRRLKNLMKKGLITEEEYKTRKKVLLEKYF